MLALEFVASMVQALRMAAATASAAAPLAASASCTQSDTDVVQRHLEALGRLLAVPGRAVRDTRSHLQQIKTKLQVLLKDVPPSALPRHTPLVNSAAVPVDARPLLSEVNEAMHSDYALRRRMLLERLDVTVQSFLWSPKAQGREGEVMAAVDSIRRELEREDAAVRVPDVFSTGPELVRVGRLWCLCLCCRCVCACVLVFGVWCVGVGGFPCEGRPSSRHSA